MESNMSLESKLFEKQLDYYINNYSLDYRAQDFRETSINSVTQYSYQNIEEDNKT